MGFDVTFHPVRLEKERRVIRELLLGKRTPDQIVRALPNCKDDLPEVVRQNLQNLVDAVREKNEYLPSVASYQTGMIAGYLRPYWFSRGQCLSF